MKILVAVDGSPFTKRMLAYLAAHDEWLGPSQQYLVMHSVAPVSSNAAAMIDKALLQQYYEESSEKVFKPIRKFFDKQGLKAEFLTKVGHAHEVIAATAEKGGYDLLVMGSHGHGSLVNLVMGSVATKVLAHCTVPVMLIR